MWSSLVLKLWDVDDFVVLAAMVEVLCRWLLVILGEAVLVILREELLVIL